MAKTPGSNKRTLMSPTSSPAKPSGKKRVMETNAAENIIATLKMAIEEQGASIEKSISDLQVTINFISEDLKELKGKVTHTEVRVDKAEQKIQTLENKVLELSRYKQRWNLRLHGLPEEDGEDAGRSLKYVKTWILTTEASSRRCSTLSTGLDSDMSPPRYHSPAP